ncbi:MAG: hypothetical protein ACXIUD_04095 [Mongoliitalea sp.]
MSWKCPTCERTLLLDNKWQSGVNKGIDTLFATKSKEQEYAFDKILGFVVAEFG